MLCWPTDGPFYLGGYVPKRYESMKKEFKREGMSDKAAKTKAAKIFNATRKPGQKPVGRGTK